MWWRRFAVLLVVTLPACGRLGQPAAEPSETAGIVCGTDGTDVTTASARTHPDGVHVRVENRTSGPVYVHYRIRTEGRPDEGNIQDAGPGASTTVLAEPPGSWEATCTPPEIYPDEEARWIPFRVVDPDRLWVPDRPGCEHPSGTHPDYREDFEGGTPQGDPGDPLDLARRDIPSNALVDLRPDDAYERAGYPEGRPRLVRVVRGDVVLAVATYAEDGGGGWIFRGVTYCEA